MNGYMRTLERERAVQDVLGYVQSFDTGLIEVTRFLGDDGEYVVIGIDKQSNEWLMHVACKDRAESVRKFNDYVRVATARHNYRIANMIAVNA